jgi:hypothetical protein
MRTKILSVLIAVIITAFSAQAQDSGIRVGILGGVNLQNLTGEDGNGDKLENKLTPGFHAGVNLMIPIAPDFNFQPGLLFSGKGAKADEGTMDATIKLSYIELPLNLLYRAQLGEGFVMIGFGPYVGYGIGGKVKFEGAEIDVKFKNEVSSSDPDNVAYFKGFDAGANIFVGYEMSSGLFLQLNSQLGLLNINSDYAGETGDSGTTKNTGFGLSVGYRF